MKILQNFTKKNLALNKKRSTVTIIGIALAVSLIVGLFTLISSLQNGLLIRELKKSGPMEYSFYNVPIDDIKYFAHNRNIKEYYLIENLGYIKLAKSDNLYKPYGHLVSVGREDLSKLDFTLVAGRLPETENEIVLSNHLKTNGGVNDYQIGNKYRDEPRPRFGLIRVREFFMKDAYSFDKDLDGLDISYNKMFNAYKNIFDRIGLDYRIVTASTGVMGGLLSEEFQAVTEIGEDTLVLCDCGYSSNIEVSKCVINKSKEEDSKEIELVHTPNIKTIKDLSNYLNLDESYFVKTLIYNIDGILYACLVSGDREINEDKLAKLMNAKKVELASKEEVLEVADTAIGFIGPIGLSIPIIIDNDILYKYNYIVGANKLDYHYINVNTSDFKYDYVGDIKNVKENDSCPICGKHLYFKHGIEVGNTFKLGTKYSESLNLKYLDESNNLRPVVMGCYGIGLGRIMASLVQQSHDEAGIIWPLELAPYKVAIVLIDNNNEKQKSVANAIYNELSRRYDVILDDRNIRAGVKFNDMDLIGIPYRITIGKMIENDFVELKNRATGEVITVHVNDIINKINELI